MIGTPRTKLHPCQSTVGRVRLQQLCPGEEVSGVRLVLPLSHHAVANSNTGPEQTASIARMPFQNWVQRILGVQLREEIGSLPESPIIEKRHSPFGDTFTIGSASAFGHSIRGKSAVVGDSVPVGCGSRCTGPRLQNATGTSGAEPHDRNGLGNYARLWAKRVLLKQLARQPMMDIVVGRDMQNWAVPAPLLLHGSRLHMLPSSPRPKHAVQAILSNPILGYDACGHFGEEPFRRAVSSLSTDVFDGDGLDGLRSAQYQAIVRAFASFHHDGPRVPESPRLDELLLHQHRAVRPDCFTLRSTVIQRQISGELPDFHKRCTPPTSGFGIHASSLRRR